MHIMLATTLQNARQHFLDRLCLFYSVIIPFLDQTSSLKIAGYWPHPRMHLHVPVTISPVIWLHSGMVTNLVETSLGKTAKFV